MIININILYVYRAVCLFKEKLFIRKVFSYTIGNQYDLFRDRLFQCRLKTLYNLFLILAYKVFQNFEQLTKLLFIQIELSIIIFYVEIYLQLCQVCISLAIFGCYFKVQSYFCFYIVYWNSLII